MIQRINQNKNDFEVDPVDVLRRYYSNNEIAEFFGDDDEKILGVGWYNKFETLTSNNMDVDELNND